MLCKQKNNYTADSAASVAAPQINWTLTVMLRNPICNSSVIKPNPNDYENQTEHLKCVPKISVGHIIESNVHT